MRTFPSRRVPTSFWPGRSPAWKVMWSPPPAGSGWGSCWRPRARGAELPTPPAESALGALLRHLQTPSKRFQPSNAHFGLMPELGEKARKKDRKALYAARARPPSRPGWPGSVKREPCSGGDRLAAGKEATMSSAMGLAKLGSALRQNWLLALLVLLQSVLNIKT